MAGIVLAGVGAYASFLLVRQQDIDTYVLDPALIAIDTVTRQSFQDFVPIRGNVIPSQTVYLDAIEGGRVDAVLVEEGDFVEAGQIIAELSNTALQLDVISREAQVAEQVNSLRNTRLSMEQNRLGLRRELVELDYQIQRLTRLVGRLKPMVSNNLVSEEDYQDAVDQLEYYSDRREITLESQAVDEQMRRAQIGALESTVERLEQNLQIAHDNLETLKVRAPVSGQLTSLDAEIGQSKTRGERLGQIDDVERFKIVAKVDEYYLPRTHTGHKAQFELQGEQYELLLDKIFPNVSSGQFDIELSFVGIPPDNLRRGQSLQMRLILGDTTEVVALPRGAFLQDSGGNWAFVVNEPGRHADRREIEVGRRNPEFVEILNGLAIGERVITSSYSGFTDMDRIRLSN